MHFNSIDEGLFQIKRTVFFGPFKLRKRVKRRGWSADPLNEQRESVEWSLAVKQPKAWRPLRTGTERGPNEPPYHKATNVDRKPWQRCARPPPLSWLRPCRSRKPLSPKFFTTKRLLLFFFFCCMNYASFQGNGADYLETDACPRSVLSTLQSGSSWGVFIFWTFVTTCVGGLFFFVDVAVKKKSANCESQTPFRPRVAGSFWENLVVFLQIHTGVFTITI